MKKNLVLKCILNPIQLNTKYKETIFNYLKENYENKSVNAGYIVNIISIKEFIHNTIYNGHIIIKLLCYCDVFKPSVGDIVNCKVNMIHLNGIFVSIYNIKILLPNKDNIFNIQNNICIYNNRNINIGDYINVVIKNIRFDNFNYTCIGNIIK
tara:strand:- start:190 stop:648 length:459 start_codon:yes stop_codon:yes gene_type:complete